MSVQQVLDRKDSRIIALPAEAAMSEVIELLSQQFIGTVMLTSPEGSLRGFSANATSSRRSTSTGTRPSACAPET